MLVKDLHNNNNNTNTNNNNTSKNNNTKVSRTHSADLKDKSKGQKNNGDSKTGTASMSSTDNKQRNSEGARKQELPILSSNRGLKMRRMKNVRENSTKHLKEGGRTLKNLKKYVVVKSKKTKDGISKMYLGEVPNLDMILQIQR